MYLSILVRQTPLATWLQAMFLKENYLMKCISTLLLNGVVAILVHNLK